MGNNDRRTCNAAAHAVSSSFNRRALHQFDKISQHLLAYLSVRQNFIKLGAWRQSKVYWPDSPKVGAWPPLTVCYTIAQTALVGQVGDGKRGCAKNGARSLRTPIPVDRLFLTTLSLRTIHCVLYSKFDKILQHFLAYLDVRQNFIKWRRGCKDRRPALRHQLAEPTALALTLSRKISGATQPGRSGQIRPPGRRNNQNSQRKDLQ